MRVRFTDEYRHVEVMKTTSYPSGAEMTVAKEIGDAAIAAGKAEEIAAEKPAKAGEAPSDGE